MVFTVPDLTAEVNISSEGALLLHWKHIEENMKKQILAIAVALSLLIPISISAIAGIDGRVAAEIPFDFMVGDKEFKAGKYFVDRYNATNTLIIRSEDRKTS